MINKLLYELSLTLRRLPQRVLDIEMAESFDKSPRDDVEMDQSQATRV
jgi:hypothetical protein